ncbi:MAG: FkbM family methyltransferase [Pirellula sp.]|jgi:FkbM family methyltransferase
MKFTSRISYLALLYSRARRFRVPFLRRATFKPPKKIYFHGEFKPLCFLHDEGVKWDFISVILENVYGVGTQSGSFKTILDIGGNIGLFSVLAKQMYPNSVVHSYEPNQIIWNAISEQARTFDFTCFNEAVGGHRGRVSMNFSAGNDSNFARVDEKNEGDVNKVSLDDAVDRIGGKVDLLKLDCEGSEWEMFREARCWERIDKITMEYHLFNGESHKQVQSTLQELGYVLTHSSYAADCHYGHLRCERRK